MSEVDKYLDDMFDRLSGTGEAGRRTLAETEDHLRMGIEEGLARHLSMHEAEHEAVARFGSPASIARQLRRSYRPRWWRPALTAAWLIASLGLVALGTSYLMSVIDAASPALLHSGRQSLCTGSTGVACAASASPWANVVAGLVLLLTGLILLAAGWLAIHYAWLAAPGRRIRRLTAALFGVAGLGLLVSPPLTGVPRMDGILGYQQGAGWRVSLIASAVAMLTAIVVLATRSRVQWGPYDPRSRRHGPSAAGR